MLDHDSEWQKAQPVFPVTHLVYHMAEHNDCEDRRKLRAISLTAAVFSVICPRRSYVARIGGVLGLCCCGATVTYSLHIAWPRQLLLPVQLASSGSQQTRQSSSNYNYYWTSCHSVWARRPWMALNRASAYLRHGGSLTRMSVTVNFSCIGHFNATSFNSTCVTLRRLTLHN